MKIIGLLPALVMALVFSSCADEKPAPEPLTAEESYLQSVKGSYPDIRISDDVLVEFAENTCQALDNGITMSELYDIILDSGASVETENAMAFAIVAGTEAFCPEHLDTVRGGIS